MKLNRVLIYGMGLMGGSLSLAIRELDPKAEIIAVVRSEKSKESIQKKKLADLVYTLAETKNVNWNGYDFVVFSTPVASLLEIIPSLPKSGETIFIDLGSTKQTIIDAVDLHFGDKEHNYISTHPICGSEQAGPEASIPNLYQDKLCILTKPKRGSEKTLELVKQFWENIGSWTINMDAKSHDETLAYVSHLPHVVSTILVNVAGNNKTTMEQVSSIAKPITGGGFRDMSRIAGSNAEMWTSIFKENQYFLQNSIDEFIKQLTEFRNLLDGNSELDDSKIHSIWDLALKQKETIQKTK
ncbi:prephenate dehydrogenase/arogenate dehydrogenase family protein [Leptospira kemamanensis]|uniref:Prephenate dehydrogenase/arogenate dehydrogenase family protein n=1 Tax=Leptospira kemamanensis TaxID=2484942 RepID=A0A4R9JR11_9LEPT|nr:prephenate dehydrogenase/arogenate dehydrogenase family protein [Leptospira kemamanensis]TGL53089.1 prephenate dehydrogenase/arogenate dehydrogenase family protein [Leptospira kemamanensis]